MLLWRRCGRIQEALKIERLVWLIVKKYMLMWRIWLNRFRIGIIREPLLTRHWTLFPQAIELVNIRMNIILRRNNTTSLTTSHESDVHIPWTEYTSRMELTSCGITYSCHMCGFLSTVCKIAQNIMALCFKLTSVNKLGPLFNSKHSENQVHGNSASSGYASDSSGWRIWKHPSV